MPSPVLANAVPHSRLRANRPNIRIRFMSNSFFRFSSVPLPKVRTALKANTDAPSESMIFQQQRRHRHERPGKPHKYAKASSARQSRQAPKGLPFVRHSVKTALNAAGPVFKNGPITGHATDEWPSPQAPNGHGIQRGGCSAGLLGVQSIRGKTLAELWQTPVELSSGPAPPPLHISPSEGGTSLPYRTSNPSVSGRLVLRNRS